MSRAKAPAAGLWTRRIRVPVDRVYRRHGTSTMRAGNSTSSGATNCSPASRPLQTGASSIGSARARSIELRDLSRYILPSARYLGRMLATAHRAVSRAGLPHHVRLAKADAARFSIPLALRARELDRIVISYALSMIPPWRVAVAGPMDCHLTPRGSLHIVNFGDQAGLARCRSASPLMLARALLSRPRETLAAKLARLAQAKGLNCKP